MKNRSYTLFAALFVLFFTACNNNHHFSISGTIDDPEAEDLTVYLYDGQDKVDSSIVKNGSFSFNGEVNENWIGRIVSSRTLSNRRYTSDIVIEKGEINVDMSSLSIGGTPLNDSLNTLTNTNYYADFEDDMQYYYNLYFSTNDAKERAMAERIYDSLEAVGEHLYIVDAERIRQNNSGTILEAYTLYNIAEIENTNYETLKRSVEESKYNVLSYKPLKKMLEQLKNVDATSEGKQYVDIPGIVMSAEKSIVKEEKTDGKLSDIIAGKLALIDFYASWCGPCRNEIKDNLIPVYEAYKDKGLVVVGVNVWERGDNKMQSHADVVNKLGITYPQLVDTTSTNIASTLYGVNSIPQIILISPDGVILARSLRGAAIREAVAKNIE